SEMHKVFTEWNTGKLDSYLIEITRDILGYQDENGQYTLDQILDSAGQKGTGKWTAVSSLEMGVPLTLISEAVNARFLSALTNERENASRVLLGPEISFKGDKKCFIQDIHDALYASKIISYAQGYMLMKVAAAEYKWDLNYSGIALLWRGGCIIRSAFLAEINQAYDKNPELENLLLGDYFKNEIAQAQAGWRRVISRAAETGIPTPAMSSALAFYDGYRSGRLPANLLQAQRDYFGAHTYERVDKPRGEFFHTDWTGEGGDVTSSTYNA
ncbi:MAG: phosphogluconate dehydrogenase (NADP(+)-dependent, decarboxylating), partial [Bacteroidetes bacterium]